MDAPSPRIRKKSKPKPRKGMTRGGAGRGQGRKKGSVTQRTSREILERVLPEGITPLELMLQEMRRPWPKKATIAEQMAWRDQALKAAVSAAPYCHPRLNAMVNPLDNSKPPEQTVNVKITLVG